LPLDRELLYSLVSTAEEVQVLLAATQLKMYSSITDERAVSALDLETKRNTVAIDEAQVQAAQAALENAQLNLDYCYVHSPIDGRAGARLVDVGNVVQVNTTALLLIQRIDPIYADFTSPSATSRRCRHSAGAGTCRICRRRARWQAAAADRV
jgi:multidrug efflux system membrane fusion protein